MIITLLDSYTRESCNLSYDVIAKHAVIITDVSEISEEHRGATLVFFEPSVAFSATPDALETLHEQFGVQPILVYSNDSVKALYDNTVTKVKADFSNVDWTFVYAVANNDQAILESYQNLVKAIDGASVVLNKVPRDLKGAMTRLYSTCCSLAVRYSGLVEENAQLQENAKVMESVFDKSKRTVAELMDLFKRSQSKCAAYETLLSKSYNVKLSGFYPEKPRVLYVKCISHLAGVDTLLTLLHSVITRQYRASCKVLTLVDASCARTLRFIPNTYLKVDATYSTSTILETDFIAKMGAYKELFELLLTNRSGLDYLIVHDLRDSLDSALDISLVDLFVNEMTADYAILSEFGNVLSDYGGEVAYPWRFGEIANYTGQQAVKLTGHPTIGSLLSDLMG